MSCASKNRPRRVTDEEKQTRALEIKKYKAELYQKNKEKISQRRKAHREKMKKENPELVRLKDFGYFLRWKYGMEISDYEGLIKKQGGCCAICGHKPIDGAKKENKLYIDHNHKTQRVRGLLCMNCNSAIGHLNDDLTIIKSALEYLEINHKIDEKTSLHTENTGYSPNPRSG
jgi:hypothetical protein